MPYPSLYCLLLIFKYSHELSSHPVKLIESIACGLVKGTAGQPVRYFEHLRRKSAYPLQVYQFYSIPFLINQNVTRVKIT